MNGNSQSFVTATSSSGVVTITSKNGGNDSNYSLSTSETYDTYNFTHGSFTATPSGASLTGGNSSPPPNGLNETYTYDPFGNLTQSGTFPFSQSFTSLNQMASGFSYDANGNQNTDTMGHQLSFDANGMLSSWANGAETYVYSALGNRAEVNDGSTKTDYVYFNGVPIASVTNGSYTNDLIYADGEIIAEVGSSQSASPVYRAVDFIESFGGDVPNSGALINSVDYAPYGQLFAGSQADPFGFTGLLWDSNPGLWHAEAREYSPEQGRWQTPDSYDGSYNWYDPQSLNRYAYVSGRPTWETDPSGLDGGCGWYCYLPPIDIICIFGFCGGGGGPTYHGSFKPRPNANPWDDKYGVPYPGLPGAFEEAFGLPTMADIGCLPFCSADSPTSMVVYATGPIITPEELMFLVKVAPALASCTFTKKVSLAYLSTGLDAVGTIPAVSEGVRGVQLLTGVASTAVSLFGHFTNASLAGTGQGLAFAYSTLKNPEVISILKVGAENAVKEGIEAIPAIGNLVSAGATAVDLHDLYVAYKGCMTGRF